MFFTYEKFSVAPNINNKLERSFTDLKSKLREHRGLNLANKEKFISWYFWLKNR
ncbi:hypothetical protein OFN97_01620 [Campylobacter sp. VBCF_05 NA6]|uniref:hypothetical protein n=1 Tax=unclassified Campylobacter TaxID=2593542 RepID=UPI0022E9E8D2|nr:MULTISPECIES: hypothetical protein [unclassified Campylobacter]MDA3056952.1 hypothetical protein [Campylobacter sp. VBCF_04 NA7]MDA3058720.1 hypothetical protein [Campylobacter sp. VBCF_05 NA6]